MKNFSFRNVNFYRLAVLYSMKAINTNFLAAPVPEKTPTPPMETEKKIMEKQKKEKVTKKNKKKVKKNIRKKLRHKYKGNKEKKGWRKNYRHYHYEDHYYYGYYHDYSSFSFSSHSCSDHSIGEGDRNFPRTSIKEDARDQQKDEHCIEGDAVLVGGGLMILPNPCDPVIINDVDHVRENVHGGFYEDMQVDEAFNLDDVADCAEADIDLAMEDPAEMAELAGEDFDFENGDVDFGEAMEMDNALEDVGNDDAIDLGD